jgi:hypothetical protein
VDHVSISNEILLPYSSRDPQALVTNDRNGISPFDKLKDGRFGVWRGRRPKLNGFNVIPFLKVFFKMSGTQNDGSPTRQPDNPTTRQRAADNNYNHYNNYNH